MNPTPCTRLGAARATCPRGRTDRARERAASGVEWERRHGVQWKDRAHESIGVALATGIFDK